jgi:hypothetical protein
VLFVIKVSGREKIRFLNQKVAAAIRARSAIGHFPISQPLYFLPYLLRCSATPLRKALVRRGADLEKTLAKRLDQPIP